MILVDLRAQRSFPTQMHQSHSHTHDHHHHARSASKTRLVLALVLAGSYMLAEAVGGWWTNSLALLADAGHMLSDVAALALSLAALWIAERPADSKRTYGYYRAEILAALVNGAALGAISIYIFVEAARRLTEPPQVLGGWMLAFAAGGLAVNLAMLANLSGGKSESLNVRGAWLHVLTDTLGSIGAIVAATLIWLFRWNWADPAISIAIGLLVIYSAWHLMLESAAVLMESAPRGIDVDQVRDAMVSIAGVLAVHDLHVWTITSGFDALSAHVVVSDGQPSGPLLAELRASLHDHFGIDHITIQIEPEGFEEHGRCE
jgi:cobalt-zinc-cadmium efflux system protein